MRFIKFVTVIGLVAIIVLGGYKIIGLLTGTKDSTSTDTSGSTQPTKTITQVEMDQLKTDVNAILATSDVSSSVSVVDVATGLRFDAGLHVPYRAASTTKVLSTAAYMHKVEQGEASLTTMIQGSTARSLMQRMLNQSDNTAWAALDGYLTESYLQSYAASIGLTSFESTDNILTATDMATLLYKMDTHTIMSKAHADLLFGYMQDTNNEELIPPGLPAGATFYHKWGFYEGELHDAAVVIYKGRSFVLVIYTNNQRKTTDDYAARAQLIQEVAKKVSTQLPLLADN